MKDLNIMTDEQEKQFSLKKNQSIISGTADFAFNHFFKYWQRYKKIIETKGNTQALSQVFDGIIPNNFDWREYAIIKLPIEVLPEGFMDEQQVARSKAMINTSIFKAEYGTIFIADSDGFFKRSLIEKATTKTSIELPSGSVQFKGVTKGLANRRYVYGIDPASEADNFAIVVLELHPDHCRVVYCWTVDRQRHKEKIKAGIAQEHDYYGFCARKIRNLMKVFPCERIGMDVEGGGRAVIEALHDPDKFNLGELPIWPTINDDDPKDTDDQAGLHVVELINFSKAEWVSQANHGMRKDLEDKVLLFPYVDAISLAFAAEEDKIAMQSGDTAGIFDTLEDCVMEIEELKDELSTIVHTRTATGRDHWDTPEVKLPGNKKGRLRKDRYTALLIANMVARQLSRILAPPVYTPVGSFVGIKASSGPAGDKFIGPSWFTDHPYNKR